MKMITRINNYESLSIIGTSFISESWFGNIDICRKYNTPGWAYSSNVTSPRSTQYWSRSWSVGNTSSYKLV